MIDYKYNNIHQYHLKNICGLTSDPAPIYMDIFILGFFFIQYFLINFIYNGRK